MLKQLRGGVYGSAIAPKYSDFQPQQNYHEIRSGEIMLEKPDVNYFSWGNAGQQYDIQRGNLKTNILSLLVII